MYKKLFFSLLILGMAFMGVAFVFVKETVVAYSPFVFLFYRFLVASMVLSAMFFRHLLRISVTEARTAFLCGIPLFLSILFQTIGLKFTTVSNSAFITGMVVLLIPFFKLIFYKKKVSIMVWISCCLALCGLYVITFRNRLSLNIGDAWTAACAISLAFYILQTGKSAHASNPLGRVTIIMGVCTVGSLLGMLTVPGFNSVPTENSFWIAILFTAIFGTVYMYAVQNYSQRYVSEEKVALAYLSEPVFATLAAVLLINEKATVFTFIGGVLIIAGMFLAELKITGLRNVLLSLRLLVYPEKDNK